MTWRKLPRTAWPGPLVLAHVLDPGGPRAPDGAAAPAPGTLACWALVDTGASHTLVDTERVAAVLGLRTLDTRRMVLAEHGAVELPVHEVEVAFPDFGAPPRRARVSSSRLPRPFAVLVGMDLLVGTRLELDLHPDGWWMRWGPSGVR